MFKGHLFREAFPQENYFLVLFPLQIRSFSHALWGQKGAIYFHNFSKMPFI